jgi:uncharacterized membrane protein YhaH (DUF805 family)
MRRPLRYTVRRFERFDTIGATGRRHSMYWYIRALEKYAVFSGRALRAEYWHFTLISAVISFVLSLLANLDAGMGVQALILWLATTYSLWMILPSWAVTVRRLHDTNRSGWSMLIGLVPLIGAIALFIWMVTDSNAGDNQYGPNPKASAYIGEVRWRSRWWLPLGLAAVLGAVAVGGIFFAANRGTEEVRTLVPWPGIDAVAAEVATVDLTPLGLQMTGTRDARAMYGSDAPLVDGAAIEYGTEGNPAAVVTALRYASTEDAGSHFSSLQGWAQGNCPLSTCAHWGGAGVIHCRYDNGHDRILWSGNWILDIETADLGEVPAADLADKVRDAAAAHWQGLSRFSQ